MLLDDFVPPAPAKGAPTATATVMRRKDPKIWKFVIFGQMGASRESAIPVLVPTAPKNAQSARSQRKALPQAHHPRYHSAPRVREAEQRQTSQLRDCSGSTSVGMAACLPEMSMIPNGEADQGTDSYMKLPILAPPSSRAGQIASVRPETPLTAIRSSQEATPAADLVVFDKQLRVLTARAKRHMATVRRNDADRDGGEFSILLGDVAQQRIILKGERPMTDVLNHRFARTWTPYGGDGEKRMLWTPRLGRAPWGGLGAPEGPQGVYSHSRGGSSRGPSGDGGGGGLDGGLMGSADRKSVV